MFEGFSGQMKFVPDCHHFGWGHHVVHYRKRGNYVKMAKVLLKHLFFTSD